MPLTTAEAEAAAAAAGTEPNQNPFKTLASTGFSGSLAWHSA